LLGSLLARYAVVNGFITSPAVANEATGQTIPYEIKGKIVFITPDERRSAELVGIGEYVGLSLLLAYVVALELRRRQRARLEEK
jgi:hypothetical protein